MAPQKFHLEPLRQLQLELSQLSESYVISDLEHAMLGKGSFGLVVKAYDKTKNRPVAIKKILGHILRAEQHAAKCLRELQVLSHLKHPNIIGLVDIIQPDPLYEFESLFIVTELMEYDLQQLLTPGAFSGNFAFSDDHFQYFAYQILLGVNYMHNCNIIHRDIKPSNVLVNSDCVVKLCDFGLARCLTDDSPLSDYVVTRWYRAPEVILGLPYGKAVDMWSIGCVLAELLRGSPLFTLSSSRSVGILGQVKAIAEVIGTPDSCFLATLSQPLQQFFVQNVAKNALKEEIPSAANPLAVHLVQQLLEWDPQKRLSATEALQHPYLAEYFSEDDFLMSQNGLPWQGPSKKRISSVVQLKNMVAQITSLWGKGDTPQTNNAQAVIADTITMFLDAPSCMEMDSPMW